MGSNRSPRPDIQHVRLSSTSFRDLEDVVRYRGTHRMRDEMNWIKEIAIQTAAKSFNEHELRDNQENFLTKIQDLRYVNGYNDVADLDFSEIQQTWHRTVLDLIDDFNEVEVFDYDDGKYVLEINVAKFTDHYIDLERILYKKARGPYD